jgi:hypothetical protein
VCIYACLRAVNGYAVLHLLPTRRNVTPPWPELDVSYAVLRALRKHPYRAELVKSEPNMKKARREDLARHSGAGTLGTVAGAMLDAFNLFRRVASSTASTIELLRPERRHATIFIVRSCRIASRNCVLGMTPVFLTHQAVGTGKPDRVAGRENSHVGDAAVRVHDDPVIRSLPCECRLAHSASLRWMLVNQRMLTARHDRQPRLIAARADTEVTLPGPRPQQLAAHSAVTSRSRGCGGMGYSTGL